MSFSLKMKVTCKFHCFSSYPARVTSRRYVIHRKLYDTSPLYILMYTQTAGHSCENGVCELSAKLSQSRITR